MESYVELMNRPNKSMLRKSATIEMFFIEFPNSQDMLVRQICRTRSYTPSPDDLGCKLKLECCLVDTHASIAGEVDIGETAIIETSIVQQAPSPPIRAMLLLEGPNFGLCNDNRFTVLTYNILADLYVSVSYVSKDIFTLCPLLISMIYFYMGIP